MANSRRANTLMKKQPTKAKIAESMNHPWPKDLIEAFPPHRPGPLERKLTKLLDAGNGEREVHSFLKRNDFLVGMAFHSNSHPHAVVSEFELGAEFRSDFLVLSCCSAWWSADFVELEPPNARLYLKDRTPSKRLRIATRQVRDWNQWIRKNEAYLRSRLSHLFERIKLPASGALRVPDAATEVRDPDCILTSSFSIVIGRRDQLSPSDQRTRVEESLNAGVNIATYDRLVEAARRYDQADAFDKEGFKYRKG